ncbi:23S rRNA (guanosine-2'-O-) -methyltransferase rlmB [hydrothermal vent metagenome]|uniref:23S rRNA (Guanosine-2'-O-) -methyltransferase rlmB n=1 Tax=hydrothermal vent metagenome TaxID=652676 RepID=A0A3B1E1I0_9ZZZZ
MIVYGKQIVFYILDRHPEMINEIFLTKEVEKNLFHKLCLLKKKIIRPDSMKAQALSRGGNHQGFLLDIVEYNYATPSDLKQYSFVLILDGLTDIGNIGAIVRSAYALGVGAIAICGLKNLNASAVIRTSSGSMLDMPIAVCQNSYDVANEFKQVGFSLVGANMDGADIDQLSCDFKMEKVALFLGSEGKGLSKRITSKLDQKIKISMKNNFDSLNVSVAAGILIHSLMKGKIK